MAAGQVDSYFKAVLNIGSEECVSQHLVQHLNEIFGIFSIGCERSKKKIWCCCIKQLSEKLVSLSGTSTIVNSSYCLFDLILSLLKAVTAPGYYILNMSDVI